MFVIIKMVVIAIVIIVIIITIITVYLKYKTPSTLVTSTVHIVPEVPDLDVLPVIPVVTRDLVVIDIPTTPISTHKTNQQIFVNPNTISNIDVGFVKYQIPADFQ